MSVSVGRLRGESEGVTLTGRVRAVKRRREREREGEGEGDRVRMSVRVTDA